MSEAHVESLAGTILHIVLLHGATLEVMHEEGIELGGDISTYHENDTTHLEGVGVGRVIVERSVITCLRITRYFQTRTHCSCPIFEIMRGIGCWRSEESLAVFENTLVGVYVLEDGGVVFVNSSHVSTFGHCI